ncbi:retrovirus-related Pol polyprotein from transposon TNT 1-94 isoform X3 [Gossypium raimondii]|uniref:retrovirus-related Pol polyprotein from transposon TNT 1-94 isoform X3 n=1 Tax=Gossypium raimondii TaxID=29730 RepID=UPI002279FF35|nr:retrovirus-related Pol polyprotein from transposon TNT 1-94 isoform X3 [Gossypium raimondii]XP_052481095.1 retrovirus-related Pol polyprotein from transposon TNT 1-94 isoform X3 [Gossypium raimondii]
MAQEFISSIVRSLLIFKDLSSGKMRGIGKARGGLYILDPSRQTTMASPTFIAATASVDSSYLWHTRLGHASVSRLNKVPNLSCKVSDVDSIHKCSICLLAKQTRLPFPVHLSRVDVAFSLVHIDLWGPYRVSTHSGHRFFLTIVDDYTRMTWVYLLQNKSDALICLKQFFVLVKNQFSTTIKNVCSDNGYEFFTNKCNEFFNMSGILHQSSCIYTPQQNGVAK